MEKTEHQAILENDSHLPVVPTSFTPASERKVSYVIKDKNFLDFEVLEAREAWWGDTRRVETLIQCFKNGYNVKEACVYTGISRGQWEYFNEVHPAFSGVKEACEQVLGMIAETKNFELINRGDGSQVRWFLERRKPEKYGKSSEGVGGPVNNGIVINASVSRESLPATVRAILEAKEAKQNGS